jgi:broad specificity phosphatase PhoE
MSDLPRQLFSADKDCTLVYLVRHGLTDWNQERRFQGHLDVPLNEVGVEQAKAVAQWLGRQPVSFSALYASDLSRAMQTATAIGEALGLMPICHRELREIYCGTWQGLSIHEVEAKYPEEVARWRDDETSHPFPGGESLTQLQARVFSCYRNILDKHAGDAVVIVSHGAALGVLICAALGWDLPEVWPTGRVRMGNTGVTILRADRATGKHEMLLFNAADHLSTPTDIASAIDPPAETIVP